ncbi:RDD family protein [Pseudoruegeria sp. SK021]|uniref:RDD family protein n=1 Tax=Pseudoruegeria sp. SK021 TaxID=1933035 RepID=UPI000A21D20D|nr:RDD family protein [Pseudoruegeria sp. SK021]OSP55295.1 hypothetical protein BV911_08410 [Pseudoruegeria sp. SK021]
MTSSEPLWGLPDPDSHAEFYSGTVVKRFLAWIVDTILILVLCVLALPFTAFVGVFFFAGLFLAIGLCYRISSLTAWSATPGMRLVAIEFRNGRGDRFDLTTASAHTVLFLIMTSLFPLQILSMLSMLVSARGQGLNDHLLGTAAINQAREW